MKTITVYDKKANEILEFVYEMQTIGWKKGKDFDFAFYPEEYDTFKGTIRRRHTVFTFYRDELATFFALKWG